MSVGHGLVFKKVVGRSARIFLFVSLCHSRTDAR